MSKTNTIPTTAWIGVCRIGGWCEASGWVDGWMQVTCSFSKIIRQTSSVWKCNLLFWNEHFLYNCNFNTLFINNLNGFVKFNRSVIFIRYTILYYFIILGYLISSNIGCVIEWVVRLTYSFFKILSGVRRRYLKLANSAILVFWDKHIFEYNCIILSCSSIIPSFSNYLKRLDVFSRYTTII